MPPLMLLCCIYNQVLSLLTAQEMLCSSAWWTCWFWRHCSAWGEYTAPNCLYQTIQVGKVSSIIWQLQWKCCCSDCGTAGGQWRCGAGQHCCWGGLEVLRTGWKNSASGYRFWIEKVCCWHWRSGLETAQQQVCSWGYAQRTSQPGAEGGSCWRKVLPGYHREGKHPC